MPIRNYASVEPKCNEFDGLLYKEQLSLIALKDLSDINDDCNEYNKDDFPEQNSKRPCVFKKQKDCDG